MIVTSYIAGGLGNQLFQISNVLAYCMQYNHKPFFIYSKIVDSVFGSRKTYWDDFLLPLKPNVLKQLPNDFKIIKYFENAQDKRFKPIKNVFKAFST